MNFFLQKILKIRNNKLDDKTKDKSKSKSKELFDIVKDISKISNDIAKKQNDIAKKQKDLYSKEFALLSKNKDDAYISLGNFLELMEMSNISIKDIISKCKHSSEITTKNTSTITLYSIVQDDHIILCKDINQCELHKDCEASKVRITTIRLAE